MRGPASPSCARRWPRWRYRRSRARLRPLDEQPRRALSGALADAAGKAAVLAEALPYMRRYAGKTILVKYGGHAMGDAALGDSFARDVVLLKQVGVNPIVVHGGGPQIGPMPHRVTVKTGFSPGLG